MATYTLSPNVKRLFAVLNNGSAVLNVTQDTDSYSVAVGNNGLFYADGDGALYSVIPDAFGIDYAGSTSSGFSPEPANVGDALDALFALVEVLNDDLPAPVVATWVAGIPSAAEKVLRYYFVKAATFPVGLENSIAKAGTAATGSVAFDVQKNGVSAGTVNFAAGATVATFTFASETAFAIGDRIDIVAPGSADATLADIAITLKGMR